jgi:hypothetical protein
MSILEEKIKNEKAFFNPYEPTPGHREKFIDLLDAEPGLQPSRKIGSIWLKIAATLLILISIGAIAFNFITESKSNAQNVLLIEYNEDFQSVLTYYDEKAANKMEEIEKLSPDSEQASHIKKSILQQFEDIDISMAAIEKDYQKNPENEKLKAAMINSKRNKVKVMDQVIQQLNMANHQLF